MSFYKLSARFDPYNIARRNDALHVRPKKVRIARSAMKSASETTPTFIPSPNSNTSVISTSVTSSGWLWSNQGDAHTHYIVQNSAEKADERQKNAEKVTREYHGIPKIRSCVLLKSNAKFVTQKGVVNEWSGCRALTGKMLVFWFSGRLQEVFENKGYRRGIACWIWIASDLRPSSQTSFYRLGRPRVLPIR